jgi:hypothetical protein
MRLILAAALALAACPVLAAERCDAPKESWRPIEDLKSELTGKGWTIKNVKTEDGCYEVYGTDADGKRAEVFFDPASFDMVGSDD